MATRVTEFDTHIGIKGKVGFTVRRMYCDHCGNEIKSRFSCKCEKCGEEFTHQMHNYLPAKEN